jgi:hypothetical protein
MPNAPVKNNISVIPSVVSQPRVGADAFGAGTWRMIGQNAETMARASSMITQADVEKLKQFQVSRVRQACNQYRTEYENHANEVMVNTPDSNALDATKSLSKYRNDLAVKMSQSLPASDQNIFLSQISTYDVSYGSEATKWGFSKADRFKTDTENTDFTLSMKDYVNSGNGESLLNARGLVARRFGGDKALTDGFMKAQLTKTVADTIEGIGGSAPVSALNKLDTFKGQIDDNVYNALWGKYQSEAVKSAASSSGSGLAIANADTTVAQVEAAKSPDQVSFMNGYINTARRVNNDAFNKGVESYSGTRKDLLSAIQKGDVDSVLGMKPSANMSDSDRESWIAMQQEGYNLLTKKSKDIPDDAAKDVYTRFQLGDMSQQEATKQLFQMRANGLVKATTMDDMIVKIAQGKGFQLPADVQENLDNYVNKVFPTTGTQKPEDIAKAIDNQNAFKKAVYQYATSGKDGVEELKNNFGKVAKQMQKDVVLKQGWLGLGNQTAKAYQIEASTLNAGTKDSNPEMWNKIPTWLQSYLEKDDALNKAEIQIEQNKKGEQVVGGVKIYKSGGAAMDVEYEKGDIKPFEYNDGTLSISSQKKGDKNESGKNLKTITPDKGFQGVDKQSNSDYKARLI